MVQPVNYSSDSEKGNGDLVRKHGRSSSSDQTKSQVNFSDTMIRSIEPSSTPASPTRSKHPSGKPQTKRRKSSTSTKTRTRPLYSRKYSTPPSRPLSPAGFPKHLDLDVAIPEIDLNEAGADRRHNLHLSVDTAPQNPDIWSDPETDYFSTIEVPGPKHARGKSRRQLSQNVNSLTSLNAMMAGRGPSTGLKQIFEDGEGDFLLPPTPGAFAS